ncbi:MAG: prepilin-type N-terminal cleavage/methylation domain-containing protein [Candidatus Staskawiczbacteria bacterium]|nr:prepilin-type N-terminal cleavage/methylation domain-containing protein [Candidatus Staskawiczbacteria bacterium]
MNSNLKKGFTIIELIVVIAIVTVLSAIVSLIPF